MKTVKTSQVFANELELSGILAKLRSQYRLDFTPPLTDEVR